MGERGGRGHEESGLEKLGGFCWALRRPRSAKGSSKGDMREKTQTISLKRKHSQRGERGGTRAIVCGTEPEPRASPDLGSEKVRTTGKKSFRGDITHDLNGSKRGEKEREGGGGITYRESTRGGRKRSEPAREETAVSDALEGGDLSRVKGEGLSRGKNHGIGQHGL